MLINLSRLPAATRYEDRYQQYMGIFKLIAHAPARTTVVVRNPPYCWIPLLRYLNCSIEGGKVVFPHCELVQQLVPFGAGSDRTAIEVLCGFRPELVDALWKIDMQWQVPAGRCWQQPMEQEFIVTTNGAFHRPEVLAYQRHLREYMPPTRSVVLVPCAADKPYPAPMHLAVLGVMPAAFYLANVTGVLGLVPQALWDAMPWYDSGIPNRWRVFEVLRDYFTRFPHERVVVYCDFYSPAIEAALAAAGQAAEFVIPVARYDDYLDLMDPERLRALTRVLHGEPL